MTPIDRADHGRDRHRDEGDEDRDATADERSREDVATERVGARADSPGSCPAAGW